MQHLIMSSVTFSPTEEVFAAEAPEHKIISNDYVNNNLFPQDNLL